MNVQGSVALVMGAGRGVGAAIAQALLERGAARVYRTACEACRNADLTLLVHCLSARQLHTSRLAGADLQTAGRLSVPAGRTLRRIEDFAPMLAANGGGAVVNVLCLDSADQPFGGATERREQVAGRAVDWVPSVGLRDRLAARGTTLIYFRAQMALGHGVQMPNEQRALHRHVALRVLDQLESDERSEQPRANGVPTRRRGAVVAEATRE